MSKKNKRIIQQYFRITRLETGLDIKSIGVLNSEIVVPKDMFYQYLELGIGSIISVNVVIHPDEDPVKYHFLSRY